MAAVAADHTFEAVVQKTTTIGATRGLRGQGLRFLDHTGIFRIKIKSREGISTWDRRNKKQLASRKTLMKGERVTVKMWGSPILTIVAGGEDAMLAQVLDFIQNQVETSYFRDTATIRL